MQRVIDAAAYALTGTVGAIGALLSGLWLLVAVVIPPVLGLIAVILSPLRALADRMRGLHQS